MRAFAALATCAALAAAALSAASGSASPSLTGACAKQNLKLASSAKLSIGTDNPAYPPWFAGGAPKGSKWKINDPATGKGFESAVAYAVAKQLGFSRSEVQWVYTPFNRSFAPGKKSFDFDINQISYSPERARVVAFSSSYYDVNQALVVVKGTPIASARTLSAVRKYKLGAQLGTTSYTYIVKNIKPDSRPSVYQRNDAVITALKNKQIDGLVVDLPTAFYVSAVQVPNSKILGQFAQVGGQEHFGMVLQKGSPLVSCVDKALAVLKGNGQLKKIQQTWLSKVAGVPVLR